MTATKGSSTSGSGLLVAGMVIPPLVFMGSIPWLKTLSDNVVFLVGGLASFMVIASSLLLAIRKDQSADEWTRSSARFSGQWGFVIGGAVLALLLAIPPFRDLIVSVAERFQSGDVDGKLVMMTYTAGFMSCIIAQMIAILLIGLGWRIWMSRAV